MNAIVILATLSVVASALQEPATEIIVAKEEEEQGAIKGGIPYPDELERHLLNRGKESDVVHAHLFALHMHAMRIHGLKYPDEVQSKLDTRDLTPEDEATISAWTGGPDAAYEYYTLTAGISAEDARSLVSYGLILMSGYNVAYDWLMTQPQMLNSQACFITQNMPAACQVGPPSSSSSSSSGSG